MNLDELPIVAHGDFGDKECRGCLYPVERGDEADLVCNECGALVRTVPIADVERTLLQMALSQGFCTATCPHCGARNSFPGFTGIEAHICRDCGEGVVAKRPIQ
jgi:hypothetical protein